MIAKLLLCLASLAAIASAAKFNISDTAKEVIESCRKEHKIEVEQIRQAMKNRKLPETEDGKCFLECVFDKGGIIKGEKIDVARLKELSAKKFADKPEIKTKADHIIDTCAKEVKKPAGKCEFGVELLKCTMKERESMGLPAPELEGY